MISRRQFIQHSALAALGAFALPIRANTQPGEERVIAIPTFVETQYVEDVIWLSQLMEALPDALRQAIYANRQFVHLGASNTAQRFSEEAMQLVYKNWNDPQGRDTAHTQLAYLLGGMLRPEFAATGTDYTEEAIYRDACLLKTLHNARPSNRPLALDQPIEKVTEAEVAQLFEAMAQRNQIRLHTFRPDFENVEGWMDHLLSWTKASKTRHRALAAVYVRPDAEKVARYWAGFYDANNPFVLLVRMMQASQATTEPQGKPRPSMYGKAMERGHAVLKQIGARLG